MAPNPKVVMEREAVNLIKVVADIPEEEEENFTICHRFVLSNLFYHKFLDPEEGKVSRTMEGMREKFLIHAQPDKALALRTLVEKYNNSPVFQEHQEQFDIKYRLLSLVFHLAENPVNVDYEPREDSSDGESVEEIDWLALLHEGEPPLEPLGSESELSDWSEEDEDEQESDLQSELLEDIGGKSGGTLSGEESVAAKIRTAEQAKIKESEEWLKDNLQFPYWQGEQPELATDHVTPGANFARETEAWQAAQGKLDTRTQQVTEYQLLREILWMLRCPTDSHMFKLREGVFHVAEMVSLVGVGEQAIRQVLGELAEALTHLASIQAYIQDSLKSPGEGVVVGRTVEAYASGLSNFLVDLSHHLVRVERRVMDQEGEEDNNTLLTFLERDFRPWFKKIRFVHGVHEKATGGYNSATSGQNPNWYIAYRILSVLYNTLLTCAISEMMPLLLDLFLRSVKAYFSIIQTWLTQGRLEDYHEEFVFYRNTQHEEQNFWSEAFKKRDPQTRLKQEGIKPNQLLEKLLDKIFQSGKSIEILSKLDKTRLMMIFDEENNETLLYDGFLANIRKQLLDGKVLSTEQDSQIQPQLDTDCREIVESAEDDYLALAFQQMLTKSCETVLSQPKKDELVAKVEGIRYILDDCTLDTLRPLESLLYESVAPSIHNFYHRSCKTLVDLFKKDLNLEKELSCARRVFFMEAGDIMHEFCTQMFKLLESHDEDLMDSSSLTLLLQDCLAQRYGSWAENFSCSYSPPPSSQDSPLLQPSLSLESLNIYMDIPWPLTIVISPGHLELYNQVFVFLAGVKRALWALQSVRLAQLVELDQRLQAAEEEEQLENSSIKEQLSDSSLTAGYKQHRLQLLRSWLLYFVTVFHGYFMSRVVHSTELELKEELMRAEDLDHLIQIHTRYLNRIYDRCFLHNSAAMLRQAVQMVLGVCVELQAACTHQTIHTRTITAWEEKYSRCHNFLSSTLNSMIRERRLPHLEGLAAALLYSCPQ